MLKSILKLEGFNQLTKKNQQRIQGGSPGGCVSTCVGACDANIPFDLESGDSDFFECASDCYNFCSNPVLAP